MNTLLRGLLLGSLVLLSQSLASNGSPQANWEIDTTATVTRVIDGDTFNTVHVGRVRLADINAPEIGQPGATEATRQLASLVLGRLVYLDIDDLGLKDRYGRTVSVVYVRHNGTHLLNVNALLVATGHADVWDFPNEFDPAGWPHFVEFPEANGEQFEAQTLGKYGGISPGLLIGSLGAAYLLVSFRKRKL